MLYPHAHSPSGASPSARARPGRSRLIRLLVALAAWTVSVPALADRLLVVDGAAGQYRLAPYTEYLEDPGGNLAFSDVLAAARDGRFRPLPSGSEPNFGYSSSHFWLRIPLQAVADAPKQWLLEVGYFSLDYVTLHIPGAPPVAAGNRLPFAARPLPHRFFLFPLSLSAEAPTAVFLHIRSTGSLTVPLTLWQPVAHAAHDQRTYAILALYYGALLALLLYNLLLYMSLRDRTYLIYCGFVASMAVGQLSMNGLGVQFLWTDWGGWNFVSSNVGLGTAGLFGLAFVRRFLQTARLAPWLDRVLLLTGSGFAVVVAAPFVGISPRTAAVLLSLVAVATCLTAVTAGIVSLRRGHPGARFFLIAWGILLVSAAVAGLRNMGWMPTNDLTAYALQLGSALEMLLLSFALADRIHTERREKEVAQADLLQAKQAMVESLEASERRLEQRVAERTADLETANARLRHQQQLLQRMAHRDPLTGLANRVLLEDRLAHALRRAKRYHRRLALLLLDLDHFKPINDAHGHAIGDEVLKGVGERLRAAVRTSDTVARIGGDEFVFVLEDLNCAEDAGPLADNLIMQLTVPLTVSELTLSLGGSVGIALYPENGTTAKELLQEADQAMYRAKKAGGNTHRVALQPAEAASG